MFVANKFRFVIVLSILLVLGGVLRSIHLFQPGFAPDEEITYFAVRGIEHHFLPVLPSGIIYDRGIPYSYSAWLFGLVFGQTIVAYRMISFVSGLAAIIVAFLLGRKTGDSRIGLMAAAFVTFAPWAILISEWGRFYSLYLTFALLTCLAYLSSKNIAYLVSLIIACLLHESGIVLVLLPLIHYWLIKNDENMLKKRKNLLNLTLFAFTFAILAFLGKGLLIASMAHEEYLNLYEERALRNPPLDHITPRNLPAFLITLLLGSALLWVLRKNSFRIPFIWAAIGSILASILELGVLLILTLFTMLLKQEKKKNYAIGAIGLSLLSILVWVFQSAVHLGISSFPERFFSFLTYGFAFPLNGMRYFLTHWPVLAATSILTVATTKQEATKAATILFTGLALATVILIGLLQVPLQPRYFLLASILFFLVVSIRAAGWKHRQSWILCLLLVLCVLCEQYISLKESALLRSQQSSIAGFHLRTFNLEKTQISNFIKDNDVIVSNDELAAIYFFGRCNYWFLPQSRYSNRYRFEREGILYGWYGGSSILANARELKSVMQADSRKRFLLILLGTGKFGGNRDQILRDIRSTFNNPALPFEFYNESVLLLRLNP